MSARRGTTVQLFSEYVKCKCDLCPYSQTLGVAGDVGGDLSDPESELVAGVQGSFGQAGLHSGLFNVHLRARRRGCCRLYHHTH